MKLFFNPIILSLILLFNNLIFAQEINNKLIGNWESVDLKNQISMKIEFKEDNKFILSNVLVADYQYTLKENMLISRFEKDTPVKKVFIDTSYLEIKQDTIIRSYNRLGWKDTVVMIRDKNFEVNSEAKKNAIVGKWKWAYPAGDTATSVFYNNGSWHFYVPQNYSTGSYSVSSDTITLTFDNNAVKEIDTYWVEGNLLQLKNLNENKEYLFRKVQ